MRYLRCSTEQKKSFTVAFYYKLLDKLFWLVKDMRMEVRILLLDYGMLHVQAFHRKKGENER